MKTNNKGQKLINLLDEWELHVEENLKPNIDKIEKAISPLSYQDEESLLIYVCRPLPKGYKDAHQLSITNLFNIRIRSWNRYNFPLDLIREILKRNGEAEFMREWVDNIRNNILIYTDEKGVNPIKWENLLAIELFPQMNAGLKEVYAIKANGERLRVYTPCADGGFEKMTVSELKEITIDHLIPLDFIINQLKVKDNTLKTIIAEFEKHREKAIDSDEVRKIDIEKLKKSMTDIRTSTDYRLMTKSENSKKGNNTNYMRYVKEQNGRYIFIMAEKLHLNQDDGKEYYVCFTSDDGKPKLVEGNAPD